MSWHLGIDIGGTFTDAVAHQVNSGSTRTVKVWSIRDDAEATITSVLAALKLRASDIRMLTFGTTIVTNAIIQGQFPRVALITTAGFGDVLEIARGNRRAIYDIATPPREAPPIPRELRFEIDARMRADGSIMQPLDLAQLHATLDQLEGKVDAVAVCLLHAYADRQHEQAVGIVCRERMPHVSLSHEVWPQLKEYERTMATVLNTIVMPLVADHVAALQAFLPRELRLELFHSAGGMMTPEAAVALPLSLALSGPAAGVAAACPVAEDAGAKLAISFDMGGTTTDVCLIVDGQPEIHEQAQVGAWTVNLPMLAVHSIGAGGGSLVSHSAAGLRVGPDSAGANPGPACYGRGGESPTLTDAAVILGYLQPCTDPQQSVQISKASAETAFTSLAGQLAMSRADTARGVVRVANANMARALRRISVDKGVDTRECALIAFGGAAPMYAAELAREVGIRTVIVPHNSSVLSALGCLSTTPSYTHQRTVRLAGTNWDATAYRQCCADVAAQASDSLLRGRAESTQVDLEYVAFMRYFGQSYAIKVPCTPRSTGGELRSAFWNRHEALYGYRTDEPYEIQSLRVTARMQSEAIDFTPLQPSALAPAAIETVTCIFENGTANIPFYQRADLGVGHTLQGPLIIADETSTTVIPPGCSVAAMTQGHLRIDIEGSS